MADIANSSNQAAILKENYGSQSTASKIRSKRKKRLGGITRIGYAEGGDVKVAPDVIPDEQFVADEEHYADGGDVQQSAPQQAQDVQSSAPDVIPDEQFQKMTNMGAEPTQAPTQGNPAPDVIPDDQFKSDEDTYGTTQQQMITAAEGVAQGVAGPLAPLAERAMGVSPDAIRMRQETNPWIHGGSEALGLTGSMLSGFGEGALLAKAGEAASTLVKGESLFAKMGTEATRAAAEMAMLQTGDELTKMVVQDPNQSVQTALTDITLSGLIGGVTGGAIGAISPLWKATAGDKAGQMVADFQGRMNQHLNTPDMPAAVTEELQNHYAAIKDMADDVYGAKGLKAQAIEKAVPEMNLKISDQATSMGKDVHDTIQKMMKKPNIYPTRLTSRLQSDLDTYIEKIGKPDASSSDIFNAAQDLKQTVQGYSKFDKFIKPVDEAYDFVKDVKGLAYNLRQSLEDSNVWGDAANIQKKINKGFVQFKPTLEDFEKRFTTKIADPENGGFTHKVDPGKIQTYMNQLGKPNAEIKKEMLANFLDNAEKYRSIISDTHAGLGVESPFQTTPLAITRSTLDETTPGAAMADAFVKKGLADTGGKALGAAIGGTAGHFVGTPLIGALIGEHTLGPMFTSMLPAMAKGLMREVPSGIGMKAGAEYGTAIRRGMDLMAKASKNIFKPGAEVLGNSYIPTQVQKDRLDKQVQKLQQSLKSPDESESHLGHYLPGHDVAVSQTVQMATRYLNSLKPNSAKAFPLDSPPKPSPIENAKYDRALTIAQQPLTILKHIKDGTLTPSDMQHLTSMYPSLYKSLRDNVMNAMTEHMSKGKEAIPYKTRLSLSLFAGKPLDSTMSPMSIVAAQPIPSQPQGAPQAPGAKKMARSTAKIGAKTNNMAKTADQSAEEDHQQKR